MHDASADDLYTRFEGAIESGSSDLDRRRRLMLEIGDALATYGALPEPVSQLIATVLLAWKTSETPAPDDLSHAKVALWSTLNAKNGGDSSAIRDQIDRSLRAALCLTELTEPGELFASAGWAAEMLSTEAWPRPTRHS